MRLDFKTQTRLLGAELYENFSLIQDNQTTKLEEMTVSSEISSQSSDAEMKVS